MTHAQGVDVPHVHEVKYHASDHEATTALVRFVFAGLARAERVVVVASAHRLAAVDEALQSVGSDGAEPWRRPDAYVALDADEALDDFMVDGLPHPDRFLHSIGATIERAAADGTRVSVYGEMVALLWSRGDIAGALELEELWNDLAHSHSFSLLCGYPTTTLSGAGLDDIRRICQLHDSVHAPASYDSPTIPGGLHVGADEYSEVFLPVPEAVSALRRLVTSALHMWGHDELVGDARLVASELGTNALVHGESPFRAQVVWSDHRVRISIEDADDGVPERRAATPESLGGRGVAIVDQVADRWGFDELPDGKVTWVELDVESRTGAVSDR